MRRPIVRDRLVPLAVFTLLVAIAFLVFHYASWVDRSNRWVLIYSGGIAAYGALCMIAGTRIWSMRGLGLLGYLIAIAGIYIGIARPAFGWRGLQDWELDVIRSCLVIGGTMMAAGLTLWVIKTKGGTKIPDPTPPDPVVKRSSERDER